VTRYVAKLSFAESSLKKDRKSQVTKVRGSLTVVDLLYPVQLKMISVRYLNTEKEGNVFLKLILLLLIHCTSPLGAIIFRSQFLPYTKHIFSIPF